MEQGAGESVTAWKPAVAGIREVLHARFVQHAYPPHTHDTWTVFIVDEGAIRYDLNKRPRAAERSMVGVLPPHVVHDGRPATADGFRKRVVYVEMSVLGEHLIGPAVDGPALALAGLRARISALHDALRCVDDALEAETRFAVVGEQIRAALGELAADAPDAPGRESAEALRAYLDRHLFEQVTIAAAAAEVHVGPTHLARSFANEFGISPHVYVLGRRLDAARDRILAGQPLADIAADVGFADQAHLTRRFRRFLGVTPGRFGRSAPGDADRGLMART
jgi:AraC-like DNA-binding protein